MICSEFTYQCLKHEHTGRYLSMFQLYFDHLLAATETDSVCFNYFDHLPAATETDSVCFDYILTVAQYNLGANCADREDRTSVARAKQ